MADKIYLVQGDTRPQIKCVISDDTTGNIVNLSGSNVVLKYKAAGSQTVLATMVGTIMPGFELPDGTVSLEAPYDLAGVGGRVVFPLSAAATNQEPGAYEGEIEITFGDNTVQTVYKVLKFTLRAQF